MKKIVVILCGVLATSLFVACGGGSETATSTADSATVATVAAPDSTVKVDTTAKVVKADSTKK